MPSSLYNQIFQEILLKMLASLFLLNKTNSFCWRIKKLREEILKIETKDFIEKKDNEEKIQIINFKEIQSSTFKSDDINIYKIASIDLKNYYCCSSHKIFCIIKIKSPLRITYQCLQENHLLVRQKTHT